MTETVQPGRRRKTDNRVDVAHDVCGAFVELAASDLLGQTNVAVKVLLDLGKMIQRANRTLEAIELHNVVTAKTRRVESRTSQSWPYARIHLYCTVRVAVDMAVKTGNALRGEPREAMLCLIEPARVRFDHHFFQTLHLFGRK